MMILYGIIIVLGVLIIIFLQCIYQTLIKQLSKISMLKDMYRREIQDLHAIHNYQDELIRELYRKITNEDIEPSINTDSTLQDEGSKEDDPIAESVKLMNKITDLDFKPSNINAEDKELPDT